MRFVLGVDGAQASFKACLRWEEGVRTRTFSNKEEGFQELVDWMGDAGADSVHVCMEATGRYNEPLARWLVERGYEVSIVNARAIKAHAASQMKRNKTDKIDAMMIADYCWKNMPPQWIPPSSARLALRDVRMYIAGLRKTLTAQKQRLKCGVVFSEIKERLERDIQRLEQEIADMYELARQLIESDEQLSAERDLLHSILGLKEKTSTVLLCKIDFHSFRSARQLACFAGLTTRKHESGESICRRGRISKMGDPDIRRALYLPACNAIRHDPAMRAFAERLAARGKPYQVIVTAVMRKMLCVSWAVVTKQQPYDFTRLLKAA
jgi:transposase